jgi:hypothetical protein
MYLCYNMKEKSVLIRKYQISSIYSHVALFTEQNILRPSVPTILRVSKENCLEVVLARRGSKLESVSQELMPYNIIQYLEILKCK